MPGVNTGDPDVYMISSTDGGTSWSAPVRVNQDPIGNGLDNYFPWIACDPVTGLLACAFYDSRDFSLNDMVETFVATSSDNGATWQDFRVSDVAWSGDGIPGFSGNYAGDYIGIAARDGHVYPVWTDNRSGNALAYFSPFTAAPDTSPPVANFSGSPTSGPGPLAVQFSDLSSHTPTSWSWAFGDGGTSTAQNPSHTYTSVGSYTVSLTATNAFGSDTNTKANYITVTSPAPNIHVLSITVARVAQPGNQWLANASVTIVDETSAPVSGATVSGTFNAPNNKTRTATTNASGVATVSSVKTKNPPANWCFTVTNVTKAGETYDPTKNVVTTGCESGPAEAATAAVARTEESLAGDAEREDIVNASVGRIEFSLATPSHVRVEVFDVSGRAIATLADGVVSAGKHSYRWDGRGVPNGLYLYRVRGANLVKSGKIMVLAR